MTSINWWTFSWVSKWKWSQGRFLMNKLHFPQVRLTVIFWHINSFIIKGSAKFRNKAECLLVLSKRFFPSKSMNARSCRPSYLPLSRCHQVSAPSSWSNWKISSKLSRLRFKSNHLRQGGDIWDFSAVCESVWQFY